MDATFRSATEKDIRFWRRMRIWKHNGLFGKVRMAQLAMTEICRADSTTRLAKDHAIAAGRYLDALYSELKNRVDP
jgi:hypothetical protein